MLSFLLSVAASAGLFKPVRHVLQNGLELLIIKNGVAPVVDISILYKIGTADDPSDKIGLSHFLEHMMFMGTKTIPSAEFKKIVRRLGGDSNAFTYYDYTVYQTKIASKHLELVLKLEADRMNNLTFSADEIKSERDVVMEERRMRIENDPYGETIEKILKAQYPTHPYGIPPIGYPEHINAYDYESTRKHYETWYAPNNAVLVVCGNVDPDQVIKTAETYFGVLAKKEIPERKRPQESQKTFKKLVETNKRNTQLIHRLSYVALGKEDVFSMAVLQHILGGNTTTAFARHFIEDKKLTLDIGVSFDEYSLDETRFDIQATLTPKSKFEDYTNELKDYLKKLTTDGIPVDEVEKAKKDILASIAFMKDGNSQAIHMFLGLACGFDLQTIEQWDQHIMNVTKEQVDDVLRKMLEAGPILELEMHPA
jgi:zinc protease